MNSKQLESIRKEIAEVKSKMSAISGAKLPCSAIRATLLSELSPVLQQVETVKAEIAKCFSAGHATNFHALVKHDYSKDELARLAFGFALSIYGVDRLLDDAQALAGNDESMRLGIDERAVMLHSLDEKLYQLETKEEEIVKHLRVDRRSDVNPMVVLGIPFSETTC